MVHQILIVLHATAAVLCFAFGVLAVLLALPHRSRLTLSSYYFGALVAMIVFLGGAILSHVRQLDPFVRAIFAGLFFLSLYLLSRGAQARSVLRLQREGWWAAYVDHIGFTLIALFEGFIIVAGIDTGVPGWLTAGLAVLGVIVGNRVVHGLQAAPRASATKS